MSIPAGIETALVNVVPPDGTDASFVEVSAVPTVNLAWAATGQSLRDLIEYPSRFLIQLPAVDQPGFQTSFGHEFRGWQYVITISGHVGGVPFSGSHIYEAYTGADPSDVHILTTPQVPLDGPNSYATKAYVDAVNNALVRQSNLSLAVSVALS